LGAAREKVRVAHALSGLPKIAAAMGRGELSYSKVRALTRVACPATEGIADDRPARHRLSRGAPGAGLPPGAGSGRAFPRSAAAHPSQLELLVCGRCDASLLRVLENPHGEPLDVGRKTRSIPPNIRRALNSRDGGCRFPGCTHQRYVDAHHVKHWAEGGETKLANLVTLCRLHHRLVHEGEITIETTPTGGWRFLHPDGRHFEVIRCTRAYDADDLEDTHAALGIHIDSDTAATRWRGERMDYDLGVWVLCNQAKRARGKYDTPAETSEGAICASATP
jgi:HNH endonuclease